MSLQLGNEVERQGKARQTSQLRVCTPKGGTNAGKVSYETEGGINKNKLPTRWYGNGATKHTHDCVCGIYSFGP